LERRIEEEEVRTGGRSKRKRNREEKGEKRTNVNVVEVNRSGDPVLPLHAVGIDRKKMKSQ